VPGPGHAREQRPRPFEDPRLGVVGRKTAGEHPIVGELPLQFVEGVTGIGPRDVDEPGFQRGPERRRRLIRQPMRPTPDGGIRHI
jgi:hypothetical protein